ncbi:MAG TPA: DNA methyltransferase, partial [Candidatus Limnocylindrales bacterium]|nr:DNA methyltransferase [Candidatus Limnocylindrales bacterium]
STSMVCSRAPDIEVAPSNDRHPSRSMTGARRRIADRQLALELVPELPALPMAPEWKDQQRLWGHSFHPMCSYLASFPASLAHAFIERYSRPGDVVLDPFSGRGTTPLQACAEGRIGVGNDLNPFAHLLTAAKVEPATRADALTRLTTLRISWAAESFEWERLGARVVREPEAATSLVPPAGSGRGPRDGSQPVPVEVALAFHARTLAQLLFVRSSLDLARPTDRFLAAALTGILHGKSASYLSPLMPNTFSMAPRYVREFAARTDFRAPERDVFDSLAAKLRRLHRQALPSTHGVALLGDARGVAPAARAALRARGLPDRARLVVSSPPYLRVVKYGYYNWLRTWLLGFDARAIDAALDDAHHREPYLVFLREVLHNLRPALTDDAIVVLVVGDVEFDRGRRIETGLGLAERVWETAAAPEGYRLAGVALDDVAPNRKMTKLWGDEAGRATKVDRILVLGATELGRRRALAGAGTPVDWTWPRRGLRAI